MFNKIKKRICGFFGHIFKHTFVFDGILTDDIKTLVCKRCGYEKVQFFANEKRNRSYRYMLAVQYRLKFPTLKKLLEKIKSN